MSSRPERGHGPRRDALRVGMLEQLVCAPSMYSTDWNRQEVISEKCLGTTPGCPVTVCSYCRYIESEPICGLSNPARYIGSDPDPEVRAGLPLLHRQFANPSELCWARLYSSHKAHPY